MTTIRPCRRAPRNIVAIFLAFTVYSCAPSDQNRLATDVAQYLLAMQAWAPIEVETDLAIRNILATQFVDDASILHTIADSRRVVRRHLHELEATSPATADVIAIHVAYTAAWERLLAGYEDIEAGLAAANAQQLAKGRAALTDWRRSLRSVASDLADVAAAAKPSADVNVEGPA